MNTRTRLQNKVVTSYYQHTALSSLEGWLQRGVVSSATGSFITSVQLGVGPISVRAGSECTANMLCAAVVSSLPLLWLLLVCMLADIALQY